MLLSIPVLLDVKVGNLNISLAQPPHIEATHMLLEVKISFLFIHLIIDSIFVFQKKKVSLF